MPLPRPFASDRPLGLLAPSFALALLLGGGGSTALAQDATPEVAVVEVDPGATPADPVAADPAVGDEVPLLDENGDEIGTVVVVEVTDPFEDFRESFPVEDGTRYLGVEVAIAATGMELEADPSDFSLQTVDGFLVNQTSASRDVTSGDVRDLERITVDIDDEVSGLVFFQIGADQEPGRLLWEPDNGRLLVVANLGTA